MDILLRTPAIMAEFLKQGRGRDPIWIPALSYCHPYPNGTFLKESLFFPGMLLLYKRSLIASIRIFKALMRPYFLFWDSMMCHGAKSVDV